MRTPEREKSLGFIGFIDMMVGKTLGRDRLRGTEWKR